MKFSELIPEYSQYVRLLQILHGSSVGKIFNITQNVKKLPEDFSGYELTNKDIEKEYGIKNLVANNIKSFHEKTGIILSSKHIVFAERHNLLKIVEAREIHPEQTGNYGCYKLTNTGEEFIKGDLLTLATIDEKEMLLIILDDISQYFESDDLSLFFSVDDYLPLHDTKATHVFTESRLNNLVDRKLLTRRHDKTQDTFVYKITKKGVKYLNNFNSMRSGSNFMEKFFLIKNDIEKLKMIKFLSQIDPYKFELLISQLLIKMGYKDVEVTSKSNDNGIDIIAKISAGTSAMKEIIQVKRWNQNVQRPVLDQLRGKLATSTAIKGSIITTSDFSEGCYESVKDDNALNLVNGEKLISLLLKNQVGFLSKKIETYTFSPNHLKL